MVPLPAGNIASLCRWLLLDLKLPECCLPRQAFSVWEVEKHLMFPGFIRPGVQPDISVYDQQTLCFWGHCCWDSILS